MLWKRFGGLLSIAMLIFSWVAQAEVAQYLQTTMGYNKPYFITWIDHSMSILMLPAQLCWHWIRQKHFNRAHQVYLLETIDQSLRPGWFAEIKHLYGLDFMQMIFWSSILSTFYILGDWTWFLGLPHVSVATGTCVFNSSCVFVYIFSVFLLGDKIKSSKILAVILSCSGVVLMTQDPASGDTNTSNQNSGLESVVGSILVLGAAIFYALYEVIFKKWLDGRDSVALVNTISGLLGLTNVMIFWIPLIILNYLPPTWTWAYEAFELPNRSQFSFLLGNAILAFSFNIFLMLSVSLASPLAVSLGCMLTIPVSGVADAIIHGDTFSTTAITGSLLIFAGFVLLTFADMEVVNFNKKIMGSWGK